MRDGLLQPLSVLFLGASILLAAAAPAEWAPGGMVAADSLLASAAGAEVLRQGGNAVDAAVAAALASGVVQPAGSGLGGGGFALVVQPDGNTVALDFREVAPAAATADMFSRSADPKASTIGGLAIAVPGESRGLALLHARHGRLSLRAVAAPAQRLARKGFAVGAHLARGLVGAGDAASLLAQGLFGRPELPLRGETVRRSSLARTLAAFARTGGEDLHSGAGAADLSAAAQGAGGLLTAADLSRYAPRDRTPLVGRYRGWTVQTMPPPSSGGVVILQALLVLEGYDLAALGRGSPELLHLLAETMQHGFADRARSMGDPDRAPVPVAALLSPARIAAIRAAIDPTRSFPSEHYGAAVDPGTDAGTLHISVVDGDGASVALTTTINTSFGSRVFAPRTGVLLNNQMDDFVARPGVPNAYGLVGSERNAVAPGARPLSSMSPTVLVGPDGRRIVVGASGGPFIISSTLQVIIDLVDFARDPNAAVAAPRIHHQWQPPLLMVDEDLGPATVRALAALGHDVKPMTMFSSVQVVEGSVVDGFSGASDPRKGGQPVGVP